jgi:LmbE family N-acetylglucosaminyl deacetylase
MTLRANAEDFAMQTMFSGERILVIAPHPDDEVLGAGGTIARLASHHCQVTVVVVTEGKPPAYSRENVDRVREEARRAHRILGVTETIWLDHPAAALTEVAHSELNASLSQVIRDVRPDVMFIPFVGDIHRDHQLIFTSSLVAARPHHGTFPRSILAYETLSETNWNAPYVTPGFIPNVFIDISDHLNLKIEAMEAFKSQLRQAPHERSIEALSALATLRGATVMARSAEAFVLVRAAI